MVVESKGFLIPAQSNTLIAGQFPVICRKLTLAVGETNNVIVAFDLQVGETLTSITEIVELVTDHLAITDARINTVVLYTDGQTINVGKAVQFTVSGQLVAGSPYTIRVTVQSSGTPAQTRVKGVKLLVETVA